MNKYESEVFAGLSPDQRRYWNNVDELWHQVEDDQQALQNDPGYLEWLNNMEADNGATR